MTARLSVLSGPFAGKTIEFDSAKFLVGREEDCDLRPDSRLISRHHCVFLQDGYTLRLRDLGSKNGTFANGTRINGAVTLNDGDMLAIGEMMLKVDLSQVSPPASQQSADKTAKPSLAQTDIFDGETLRGQASLTEISTIPLIPQPNSATLS